MITSLRTQIVTPLIRDPNARLTYTRYPLWLYQNTESFKRLDVDTPETLKYRRRNYYLDRNRNTCVKITGASFQKHNKSWWINKHPLIVVPYFIALWIITKFSPSSDSLFDEQFYDSLSDEQIYEQLDRHLTILNILTTMLAIFVGIIGIVVTIAGILVGLKIANII